MIETSSAAPVILVPHRNDILATAARHIIGRSKQLPDLLNTVVLLPDLQCSAQLRRQLLHAANVQGHTALLGPHISTPDQWLEQQTVITGRVPGRAQRELMLVEALQQHPGVYGDSNPWQLAASLVVLFDELTRYRVELPESLEAFTAQLQSAYGIEDRLPEPLGMEARIVHRLWRAWHVQLDADNLLDPGLAQLARITAHATSNDARHVWFIGVDGASNATLQWLDTLMESGRAHCLLRPLLPGWEPQLQPALQAMYAQARAESADEDDPAGMCLDAVFDRTTGSLGARAAGCRQQYSKAPLSGRLAIFSATSAELEARAIDLQVRRWLLADRQPLAIVTEDRRLARRVRALLERADITPQDPGGWALSTTSAAAALERWLETIEEDFAHQPLLDILKSPFILPDADPDARASDVFRLETDIIRHGGIARGLQRYRRQIDLRVAHLPTDWTAATAKRLHLLLNRLDHAADPLAAFIRRQDARPLELLDALRDSMEQLGLWQSLDNDPAGQRILYEWRLLHDAAEQTDTRISWTGFRSWLGAALERHDFRPTANNSPVHLLTLAQAQSGRYAGIIIGACDNRHLPSANNGSPFFNDRVRGELGLPVWPHQHAWQLHQFRNLLQGAPHILLTWHNDAAGDARAPSPFLSALQTFHTLGWQKNLEDTELTALLEHPGTCVQGNNPLAPVPAQPHPEPVLPEHLLPTTLAVSAHRQLIDCPYRFFAATGLALKVREEIREAFEKSDYGNLVHRILEIFHQGRPGYPPAFSEPLADESRTRAIDHLTHISKAVFTRELEDNFADRAWLHRWLQRVPEYIDWQIRHQADWGFLHAEKACELALSGNRALKGRLDRIDRGDNGDLIIDYKTGRIPRQPAIDSGEEVQLPSYALLASEFPAKVMYLQLDKKVKETAGLEGDTLRLLSDAVHARLDTLLDAIAGGHPLPAWGDPQTCTYCDMDGLCRRQAWTDTPA